MVYRTVAQMSADELLAQLQEHVGEENAVHQITLFARMGGDPKDHNYARISFLTRQLRERGLNIGSSRNKGVWLNP